MPIFDLKKITAIKGKQVFYQLTIDDFPDYKTTDSPDDQNNKKTGVLDLFERELESKYRKNLLMIYSFMERVANNLPVSGAKYHELKRPKIDSIKEFEFKHGDIRVYAFKSSGGKIFVLGGYKNNQDSDIIKMRSLKKQYLVSLKSKV